MLKTLLSGWGYSESVLVDGDFVGLATAMDLAYQAREANEAHIRQLRDHCVLGIRQYFPEVTFNGDLENGHYKVLSLAFPPSPKAELILFNLDETNYARELAPLAGHYPAVKLGPPWWFHDSLNGIARFFDQVIETAGLYNTVGFNDDTRAFLSIPARHDLARRMDANFVAGLVARHRMTEDEGMRVMRALAVDLVRETYRL